MDNLKMGAKATGESNRDNWQTPPWLLQIVAEYYHGQFFDPSPVNPDFDGLKVRWVVYRNVWINPPFSDYELWVDHGLLWHDQQCQIWLSHHNHDTKWFRRLRDHSLCQVQLYSRVRFIDPVTGIEKGTAFNKCQTLHFVGGHNLARVKRYFSSVGQVMLNA